MDAICHDKLSQDLLLRHLQMNREQNERLATMLERDPRLALVGIKKPATNSCRFREMSICFVFYFSK